MTRNEPKYTRLFALLEKMYVHVTRLCFAFFFNRFGMLSKGDETSWTIMFDRFRSEENAQEKNKLLYGLGKIPMTSLVLPVYNFVGTRFGINCTKFARLDKNQKLQ